MNTRGVTIPTHSCIKMTQSIKYIGKYVTRYMLSTFLPTLGPTIPRTTFTRSHVSCTV